MKYCIESGCPNGAAFSGRCLEHHSMYSIQQDAAVEDEDIILSRAEIETISRKERGRAQAMELIRILDSHEALRDDLEKATRQRSPSAGRGVAMADLVKLDIDGRDRAGTRTYGVRLRADNGRDALWDAYEEALDLALYLRQAIVERDERVAGNKTQEGE